MLFSYFISIKFHFVDSWFLIGFLTYYNIGMDLDVNFWNKTLHQAGSSVHFQLYFDGIVDVKSVVHCATSSDDSSLLPPSH